jgi:hypothetical protein
MGAVKELWFARMCELQAQYEEEGMDSDAAYERACDAAFSSQRDTLADIADMERKRRRENG